SFLPGKVHFANDGPLGSIASEAARMPSAFLYTWQDTNVLGQNNGGFSLPVTGVLLWLLGPIGFAKFDPPVILLLLPCSAGLFFWRMGLAPIACIFGALAAVLNSTFFSVACWGVGGHALAAGTTFLALAATVGDGGWRGWLRLALGGLAVGVGVIEAAD